MSKPTISLSLWFGLTWLAVKENGKLSLHVETFLG